MEQTTTQPTAETPPAIPVAEPETPATPPADESSLADHEAAYAPGAAARERNEAGQFVKQPRHRAKSQQATAEDVPRIQELTRKLREAEARAAAAEQRTPTSPSPAPPSPSQTPAQPPAPSAAAPPPQQAAPRPQAPTPQFQPFPSYEQWSAAEGNGEKSYDDYRDEREEYRYQVRRAIEQHQEAAEQAQRTRQALAAEHEARLADAKAKYADWDQVFDPNLPVTAVIAEAVLGSKQSRDLQYHLSKHRDVLAELNRESFEFHPSAVAPMRRYLESLVASEQRSSATPAKTAAASTGSAPLALVQPSIPKPPNPVRTGSVATTEQPPGDDSMSIADHEKWYGKRRA